MHAAVCLLHAGQLKHAGDVAKSGEFLGELSWVEFDPMGVRGLFQVYQLGLLVFDLIYISQFKSSYFS